MDCVHRLKPEEAEAERSGRVPVYPATSTRRRQRWPAAHRMS